MTLDGAELEMLGFGLKEVLAIRRIISSLTKCYQVKATYKGAKKIKGIRAAIYREVEKHCGYYSSSIDQFIWYNGDDLEIAVFFEGKGEASKFFVFLSQWHLENPYVVKLNDIYVEKQLKIEYFKTNDLVHIRLVDYHPQEHESPIQSLANFLQSRSSSTHSHSTAEVVPLDDPNAKYQSVEKLFANTLPYKCHIKPKRKFKDLMDNENNLLLASWIFHQYFDGFHTVTGTPLIAIYHISTDNTPILMDEFPTELRTRVEIGIECFSQNVAEEVGGWLKMGSERISDIEWKTFVHVKDPEMFCSCLEWKYKETKVIWENEI